MKRIFTLLVLFVGFAAYTNAQTPLLTGETSPEAITYYDFVEWAIDEGKMATWYVDFGDGGPYTQFVDNPDTEGINETDKALYMETIASIDWWGNFLQFRLETPMTITEDIRYLHMFHWREKLNDGWSININTEQSPHSDAEKGTLRFDGNNAQAGVWEDIVIDLKYLIDEGLTLNDILVIVDKDWSDPKDNPPSKYYFDEIILSDDPLQRGVTILEGTDILNAEEQTQLDELVISTQNESNTYSVIDNPFTDSWLNADGKVVEFFKSDQASWWQGFNVTFPGIHAIEYGTKQYLHVLVRTDTTCFIQLHAVDNLGFEHTEMFLYPMEEIDGDWFDLVWDLSTNMAALKSFTVRFDIRMDADENYLNGTPARNFYVDEITLDDVEDPREGTDPSIGIEKDKTASMIIYSMDRTIYFDMPGAERAEVYDMLGRKVASAENLGNLSGQHAIEVPQQGVYILRVAAGNRVATEKILVK